MWKKERKKEKIKISVKERKVERERVRERERESVCERKRERWFNVLRGVNSEAATGVEAPLEAHFGNRYG